MKSNYFYYKASESDIGKADIVDEADYDRVVNPLVSQSIFYAWPAIWAAIYRTDFLKKHNIRCLTTPGASYQDISFNFKVWVYARRVYFYVMLLCIIVLIMRGLPVKVKVRFLCKL